MSQGASASTELRWRLYVLFALMGGFVLVLVYRLYDIQITHHDYYRQLAVAEHWREEKIPARRGALLDARGQPLALTVTYFALYASTKQVSDPAGLARLLAPIVGEGAEAIAGRLRVDSVAPVLIKRGLSGDDAQRVRDLRQDALLLRRQAERAHPQGDLASQLLGVVGADGEGLSGAEMGLDHLLAGKPGLLLAERDTGGELITLGPREYTPPVAGADVVLTIDRFIQRLVERELDAALQRHRASAGTIVVMEPATGEVLAVASRPSFRLTDPDLFAARNVALYRLPAVSDSYEPGSTFKAITVGAAIDANLVTPKTTYFNNQAFRFGGGVVTNWVKRKPQDESIAQLLQRSSNIGAAWVATTMGADPFYRYVTAFGFGQLTGIELPGESPGLLLRPAQPGWHPFNLATNSFGQGMAVTPVQLARGMSTLVNGGRLVKPHLVKEVRRGDRVERPTGEPGQLVIAPQTSATMRELLVSVVDYEEGGIIRKSRLPGYRLGAKTGTAEVPSPRGYTSATIASIVGFGPAESPRFVILVKIDEPKDSPWGEDVAAPVFRNIAGELMTYYAIPPTTTQASR